MYIITFQRTLAVALLRISCMRYSNEKEKDKGLADLITTRLLDLKQPEKNKEAVTTGELPKCLNE